LSTSLNQLYSFAIQDLWLNGVQDLLRVWAKNSAIFINYNEVGKLYKHLNAQGI